jgi:hypothetical protein
MTDTVILSPAEIRARQRAARDLAGMDYADLIALDWDGLVQRHLAEESSYQTDAQRSGLVFTDELEGE